jgi:hypothetical protein
MYEKTVVMLYLLIGASIAFQHPESRFFDDARQGR